MGKTPATAASKTINFIFKTNTNDEANQPVQSRKYGD